MSYRFYTADVFTDQPFGGNQLAVLPDARGLDAGQMQAIAREFNYSETVFVFPPENRSNARSLRIFTPGGELPFAGHPTVGTAHVLAEIGDIPLSGEETRIVLEEKAGPVPVLIRAKDGQPVFAELAAPRDPEFRTEPVSAEALAGILSLEAGDFDDRYPVTGVSVGVPFLMVPVRSLEALGRARMNTTKWSETLENNWASETFLFTQTGENEFRARMFAPTMGIVEDPATGSACAGFGAYLASMGAGTDGTRRYTVHQGVEMGRPSLLQISADVAGGKIVATRVGGATVLVASGELYAV